MEEDINRILDSCYYRREMGAEKYGKEGWVDRDEYKDAREELYDLVNYSLFLILKLNRHEEKHGHLQALREDEMTLEEQCRDVDCRSCQKRNK